MLSIPNDGYDTPNIEKNIIWCEETFTELGFDVERVMAKSTSPMMPNHPLLIANKFISKNYKTVLIYFHMDGQPVDPSKWNQENPFTPVYKLKENGEFYDYDSSKISELDYATLEEKDIRIFARASSDAKGPVMMLIQAIKFMNLNNIDQKLNLIFLFDE